jgi:hypothetical protein
MSTALMERPLSTRLKLIVVVMGIAVYGLVVFSDYITTEEISLSIFYLLPIGLMFWFIHPAAGGIMAILSALVWPVIHLFGWGGYPETDIPFWDAFVKLGFYVVFLIALSRIRKGIQKEKQINEELTHALREVKQLSGLLPICASCKKIRDDKGYWTILEAYIQDHSKAQFSHGICPDCVKKLYPEMDHSGP